MTDEIAGSVSANARIAAMYLDQAEEALRRMRLAFEAADRAVCQALDLMRDDELMAARLTVALVRIRDRYPAPAETLYWEHRGLIDPQLRAQLNCTAERAEAESRRREQPTKAKQLAEQLNNLDAALTQLERNQGRWLEHHSPNGKQARVNAERIRVHNQSYLELQELAAKVGVRRPVIRTANGFASFMGPWMPSAEAEAREQVCDPIPATVGPA